jgi:hypothetical protein
MPPDAFADRYVLARFAAGGVVVDLETGNYFRVDAPAAEVCEVLRTTADPDAAANEVAARLDLPRAHAATMLADTRAALAAAPARGTPAGPYHFHPQPGGYGLWHAGRCVLTVGGDDAEIRVSPGEDAERSPRLEFYVRALAPKLMYQRGLSVLHASACAIGHSVVAFAGPSGAGKTTTARAFAAAGARSLAEDLVVLKAGAPRASVVLDGEARVHDWARQTAAALAAGAARVSSAALATMADGAATPIDAVLFVDETRRAGTELAVQPLSGPDGLLALMANDFLGGSSRAEWRRFFATALEIASATELGALTAPRGLGSLEAAAARYMSNWTS